MLKLAKLPFRFAKMIHGKSAVICGRSSLSHFQGGDYPLAPSPLPSLMGLQHL
jgi:hypothetical protein